MKVEITAALCIGEYYGKQEVIMTTTVEQLAGITSQHNEIVKRISNGSLDPVGVKRALQDIVEGRVQATLNWGLPNWWRTPEQQVRWANRVWPDIALPEPPEDFLPRTKSEVLLLHIPMNFHVLWNNVDGPAGAGKWAEPGLAISENNLRLLTGQIEYDGPTWIAFDPEFGRGLSPDLARMMDGINLASSEVMSALFQFPEWPLSWSEGASPPTMSGFEYDRDGSWSHILYFDFWESEYSLKIIHGKSSAFDEEGASPSVRLC